MTAIFLREEDVRQLVNMSDAVKVTEQAFRHLAEGAAFNQTRGRLRTNDVMLHALAGVDRTANQLGWKMYTTTRTAARFLVGIYNGTSGTLEALIEADYLGQLRTGAASGVATKYLSRNDSETLGLIGTGLQSRTQAWAIAEVCHLKQIFIYGRNAARRTAFAKQLAEDLSLEVIACESADQAVEQADVIVTATTSQTPVFDGKRLKAGTHINAVGSNFLKKTELDLETLKKADIIACDSRDQCRLEAGDFVEALSKGILSWDNVAELSEVVTGQVSRDTDEQITLFKSVGLGLQDVALGSLIVERGKDRKIGIDLPF
ncbi:ornithine cyclodeaminase family protein [Rubinisphaera italica]|uniref:L-lysine cyclodeaminase n=1 Tax=Rubinisphaera italica TaxID=2527969 RepID=A0A5C5XG07_9PLAN|nr:ornithine cyclodeaminase family protein [Rubinisphaera italica]TWT62066.1 L-lysine cyclodeaminase [Rubinisphaera italica]